MILLRYRVTVEYLNFLLINRKLTWAIQAHPIGSFYLSQPWPGGNMFLLEVRG